MVGRGGAAPLQCRGPLRLRALLRVLVLRLSAHQRVEEAGLRRLPAVRAAADPRGRPTLLALARERPIQSLTNEAGRDVPMKLYQHVYGRVSKGYRSGLQGYQLAALSDELTGRV